MSYRTESGFSNWAIYLDHIPNNAVNWLTRRNSGFSDAADLFVFISGYTAAFVYARSLLSREFVVGSTRLLKRAWQIYIVFVVPFSPVLWAVMRRPNQVLAASFIPYLAARHFDWNLSSYPTGVWYFNPFCRQLPFVFGAWFALGGPGISLTMAFAYYGA